MEDAARFRAAFEPFARTVRRRRALRATLSGLTLGLSLGLGLALAFHALRLGGLRPWTALLGPVGGAAALALSRRRALSEGEVALYLDACLGTREVVTTALSASKLDGALPARDGLLRRGIEALEDGDPKLARPRWLRRPHFALPFLALSIGALLSLAVPEAASPSLPPGSALLRLTEIPGLAKIEELEALDTLDPAEKARLDELSREAKRLRERLREGVEKREAQAEIAKLRDAIVAEKLALGDGDRRAGFEAAIGRLAAEKKLRDAAKALGDRDLQGLDEALEKLANERERRDRREAEAALEEAEELARRAGAPDVAEALAEARERMKRQEARADLLRELAEALGDSVKGELDDFDALHDPESAAKLAEALGRALEKLSKEERQRLAERLSRSAGDESLDPGSRESLRDFAEQLSSPEGVATLTDELRRLANEEPPSDGARRQQALEDAERGAAEAEGQISGRPVPIPMAGGATTPPKGSGADPGGDIGGPAMGGGGEDEGRGSHAGETPPLAGNSLPSRTGGPVDQRMPMPSVAMGRAPAQPGETAKALGTGALPSVGKEEISGVERSEVPEEYREQVGRYFQP